MECDIAKSHLISFDEKSVFQMLRSVMFRTLIDVLGFIFRSWGIDA
jgi:hypothetical protein